MSLIIDGSNGVTFPNGSGPQFASAKVIQVVQGSTTSTASTTSTTYVNSNLTASITPQSTNSKILIIAQFTLYYSAAGGASSAITRGSTLVYSTSTYDIYNAAGGVIGNVPLVYLDSPSTTSSTTYTVKFASGGGSATYLPYNNQSCTITLLEISGS